MHLVRSLHPESSRLAGINTRHIKVFISQVIPHFFCQLLKFLNDFGIKIFHIIALTRIPSQIIKSITCFPVGILPWPAVISGQLSFIRPVSMWQYQFPLTFPYILKAVFPVEIEKYIAWICIKISG